MSVSSSSWGLGRAAVCALNPPVVCSADRSKAVVPVLVLHLVALWFVLRGDLLCVFPFTSLGEERANLSAFRTFVRFVLV